MPVRVFKRYAGIMEEGMGLYARLKDPAAGLSPAEREKIEVRLRAIDAERLEIERRYPILALMREDVEKAG